MDHYITIRAAATDEDADPSSETGVSEIMHDQIVRSLLALGLDDVVVSSAG